MRTMLLSFKPEWYEKVKSGSKIFEYRRSFADEEVMAYMYVSSPQKEIVGKIHLGKRISLESWKELYQDDKIVVSRIEDFMTRHKYVMPILSFQMTEKVDLGALRTFDKKFVCPQMYYYLDNYPQLFEFIRENVTDLGQVKINDFTNVDKDDICRQKY